MKVQVSVTMNEEEATKLIKELNDNMIFAADNTLISEFIDALRKSLGWI